MITKKFSMLMSSAVGNGAKNKTAFGNRFDVSLNTPIAIPRDALNARLEFVSGSAWNSASNISPAFGNNTLALTLGGTSFIITFPAGLYSLSAINSYVSNQLTIRGFAGNRISFDANYATSQVGAYMTVVGDVINFAYPNSIGNILGFTDGVISCTVPNTYVYGNEKATLNRVSEFVISVSLLSGQGIPLNNNNSNILTTFPITAAPNSLIVHAPSNLVSVPVEHLRGQIVNQFSVALLDQEQRDVDTNGEDFQFVMTFSYEVKV